MTLIAAIDPQLLFAPFMLFVLGLAVVSWIAMMGGSLQFSLWLLMDHPPGFLKSLLMAMLIVVINVVVFFGFHLLLGPQPWYVTACYQALLQVVLVMLVVRCNPVTAFFAAFAHSIFSVIGTIVLFVALFFAAGSTMQSAMQRHKEEIARRGPVEVANPFAQGVELSATR